MIPFPTADGCPADATERETVKPESTVNPVARVKIARILDGEEDDFALEYDDTRGEKNTMRLDASTYEGAIREARTFLGIQPDDHDQDGDLWAIE